MNFFEQQQIRRRNTRILVVLFLLSVALLVFVTFFSISIVLRFFEFKGTLWDPYLFSVTSGLTLLVIAWGSIRMWKSLSNGGVSVAERLNGRRLDLQPSDKAEMQLRNVVEEMAIASGTPVPKIYILDDEPGINAFASGLRSNDTVIGVTRGAVEKLTRDELQGVIAHEFSHVLYGDMLLNMRTLAILHGILAIGLAGKTLLRLSTSDDEIWIRGKFSNRGAIPFLFPLGAFLAVVGYFGVFLGNLIKWAISQQRELLADASAVRFTRNPLGVLCALKKVGGLQRGSRIRSPHAEALSHLFFGSALRESPFDLFPTHPPLKERIKLLDPTFDGTIPPLDPPQAPELLPHLQQLNRREPRRDFSPWLAADVVPRVARVSPGHLAFASAFFAEIPPGVAQLAHDPIQAQNILRELLDLAPPSITQGLPPEARLPLIDLLFPALRRLTPHQQKEFIIQLREQLRQRTKLALKDFVVVTMLKRHFLASSAPRIQKFYSIKPLLRDMTVLLSSIAYSDAGSTEEAAEAYARSIKVLGFPGVPMCAREECDLIAIDRALHRLADAVPRIKQNVVHACAAAASADGKLALSEAELLRAIGETLDCPIPPFI